MRPESGRQQVPMDIQIAHPIGQEHSYWRPIRLSLMSSLHTIEMAFISGRLVSGTESVRIHLPGADAQTE